MTSFDNKFRDKLDSYHYDKEPSDEQVSDFFQKFNEGSEVKSRFPMYMKLAASIVLIIGATWVSWSLANIEVTTGLAEVRKVQLPDQSVVTLNAKSTLSFNRVAWLVDRNVRLEGEAFFKVKKGENFAVISSMGTTEVLGTSFNIYTRNESYEVKCHTGKVRVTLAESKTLLEPGNGVIKINGKIQNTSFDTLKQTWKEGEYHYNNAFLREVITDLELAFGLTIDMADVDGTKRYTGYFPSTNQAMALKLVFEPLGYNYSVDNNRVIVYREID